MDTVSFKRHDIRIDYSYRKKHKPKVRQFVIDMEDYHRIDAKERVQFVENVDNFTFNAMQNEQGPFPEEYKDELMEFLQTLCIFDIRDECTLQATGIYILLQIYLFCNEDTKTLLKTESVQKQICSNFKQNTLDKLSRAVNVRNERGNTFLVLSGHNRRRSLNPYIAHLAVTNGIMKKFHFPVLISDDRYNLLSRYVVGLTVIN